ncbi:amidohydrolase family protein [Microbulbifer halophilus]|uniref:amidohydrolase family protein n=1 Tax=Microbulbifer halophilus TaxID=453963 RepID=UPI002AD58C61|nr:amidohydrolase family protein [Microbulbifer halophilus]
MDTGAENAPGRGPAGFPLDAAYAAHQETVIGNLAPGKAADFLLLDRDIFAADPQDLWRTRVLETWVAGERLYTR